MNFSELEDVYSSRTAQQDDEEQATSHAASNLECPIILWNMRVRERFYPEGLKPELLVLATSRASCALINAAYSNKQVLGTCILPEVSLSGHHVQPSLKDQSCVLYACGQSGEMLLICSQYSVKPERSVSFIKALLHEMHPKQVLILGGVPSDQLWAGDVDPSQEAALFLLSTEASKQVHVSKGQGPPVPPIPYLPSGSIVTGLAAACLSYCQARSMYADLVVAVDMVPGLAHLSVRPLADAACKIMSAVNMPPEFFQTLQQPGIFKRAAMDVERAYGSSLDGVGAVFV
ncbi:hypothetical protein CEUSTIGMA_g9576.t1 [Chlamydomonas eustigma]|uniref:Proteasome assembly chaperone 1 n=1 Tax=Chlamydomonas eustigma TaxID=1157962 RepID=A0A250XGE4_9CHLO|nr:hypothetical protein CEUSTIGMA_g9576.t1 [Chlamydomonas eustigma]|eukprot:GAX82148.1 hypothetical protein CEUSTIGMA_g9576.t1 [Chlamydomonas eustigma]